MKNCVNTSEGRMQKVLIEVSKDILDNINEPINDDALLRYIIKKGVVLDGLTNGEVMQKMFPDAKFYCTERLQTAGFSRRDADFDLDWWNRKWGE